MQYRLHCNAVVTIAVHCAEKLVIHSVGSAAVSIDAMIDMPHVARSLVCVRSAAEDLRAANHQPTYYATNVDQRIGH